MSLQNLYINMPRRYKKKTDVLINGGYINFCPKCGRRSARRTLFLTLNCYYCDEGNAGAPIPTKKRRVFKKRKS